jgi:hypothetical protein
MTGQDVVDAVSSDIRGVLSNSGADATKILGWVERVHKELLRTSRWKFLLSDVKTFNTVIGEDLYYIGAGSPPSGATNVSLNLADVEFIKARSVVDRTNNKRLSKTDEKPLGDIYVQNNRPTLYRFDSSLAGHSATVATCRRRVRNRVPLLQDAHRDQHPGTVLQVPDDYKDIVIAGVNAFACLFLKKFDEAGPWQQMYQDGKRQMIRDANLFPREDFIRPDYVATPQDHPDIYNPFQQQF